MKGFLDFGRCGVKTLVKLLFWIGALGIYAVSMFVGYTVSAAHVWHRMVQISDGRWTSVAQNHWPLGFLTGFVCFVISFLLWRLVCEMLYIVLNYFKENT